MMTNIVTKTFQVQEKFKTCFMYIKPKVVVVYFVYLLVEPFRLAKTGYRLVIICSRCFLHMLSRSDWFSSLCSQTKNVNVQSGVE